MNVSRSLPALCLLLALSWTAASQAQNAAPQQPAPEAKPAGEQKPPEAPPAKRETPPDAKAYQDATRTLDPVKKIEALEKFKKDFPKSSNLDSAEMAILTALAKMPGQESRARRQAKLIYDGSAKDVKGRVAASIADALIGGAALLKDAESYARKGVKAMKEGPYIRQQIAASEKRKQKPPARDVLAKRFRESRASRVAVLGRVELAMGKDQRAKEHLQEAQKELPSNTAVTGALGELAVRQGDHARAMELLVPVRLAGRITPSTISALESAYRKTHNGSVDGLEETLNLEYRKRFPNPIQREAYKPPEKRSGRVALAEVFTGAGCPPCTGADLAFDAAMERYSRKELAVLMYHVHVPRPDPMTNPQTQARSKFYDVTGVPTFAIDGKTRVGGGGRDNAKEIFDGSDGFKKDIESELELAEEAQLTATASVAGGVVKVAAAVNSVKSESHDLKLQIVLAEKEIVYSGENGVRFHPMVVRAIGGPNGEGFALDAGKAASFRESFDLAGISESIKAHLDDYESKGHRGEFFRFAEKKHRIDPAHLAVVVFVEDAKARHILQAAYVDLSEPSVKLVSEQK